MARPRLTVLEGALTRMFKPAKPRAVTDKDYLAFRAECKARNLTYKINRDGYIDFSDGRCFAHHDWQESLTRLRNNDFAE